MERPGPEDVRDKMCDRSYPGVIKKENAQNDKIVNVLPPRR
jgi:hypothetical protein